MKQTQLREEALKCADDIRSSKLFMEPFQHAVIDNFLSEGLAKAAMDSFPPLSDPSWDHSNDKGIEVKSRTTWKSEFDVPENIIDVIRIANSSLILEAMSDLLKIPKLMPDPYFSGGGLNVSEN